MSQTSRPAPMIMCRACRPVMPKYSEKYSWACAFRSGSLAKAFSNSSFSAAISSGLSAAVGCSERYRISNAEPGMRWWSNFCLYSITLTPRNTVPSASVEIRKMLTSCFLPTCADQTAMAMVKLLRMRTTVLPPPSTISSVLLPAPKAVLNAWRLIVYVRKRPPKNKTSVTRKIHMPSAADSFCWSSVSKCPYSSPVRCTRCSSLPSSGWRLIARNAGGASPAPTYQHNELVVSMSRGERLCPGHQSKIRTAFIVVWLPGHFGCDMEIFRRWRRIRFPFKARGRPGIWPRNLAVTHGPNEVNHRQQIAQRENRPARRGQDVQHLKFRRIGVIAPRHAEIAKKKLRKERQIEADEQRDGRNPRQGFRIKPAGNLRPPEVQAADVTHDRAADHDVVEMGDHEVGVVNVNVQAQAGEEESGEAADQEQSDEAEGVEHGRIP